MPDRPFNPALDISADAAARLLRSLEDNTSPMPFEAFPGVPSIPGYTVVGLAGRGGSGTVYRAFRDGSDCPVAIKIIREIVGKEGVLRAERELQLLRDVRSDHVPRVLDFGSEGGHFYLVEEFVEGERLDEYCESFGRTDLRARVSLLAQAARAVQTLHDRGVIHRDLKPSNMLVTLLKNEPLVMIVDFGLAFHAEAPITTISQGDTPAGTPAFMAPEQARGERENITTRTDVYALGATAYEILTGMTPHDMHGTFHQAMSRVMNGEPRDLRSLRPDLSAPLAAVLGKACARDPEARYARAAEFAADLERWLRGEPVEATTPGPLRRMVRWVARHPRVAFTIFCAAVAILTGVGIGVGTWWTLRKPHAVVNFELPGAPNDVAGVRLVSRAGNIIHEWIDNADGDLLDGHLVNRPDQLGGGKLVLVARRNADQPGIFAYDAYHPDGPPVWTSGFGPKHFTIPARSRATGPAFMAPVWVKVEDTFPDAPGDEIIALHNHTPLGHAVVRIYDLDGKVLFEAWHRGHLRQTYWVKGAGTLIVLGVNDEATWNCRGHPEAVYPYPAVVFALKPAMGARLGRITTSSAPGDTAPEWYKWVTPAVILDRLIQGDAVPSLGKPPANRSEIGGLDPDRVWTLSAGVVSVYLDSHGKEVGRRPWVQRQSDPNADHDPTLDPSEVGLADLPPIVPGCE